MGKLYVVLKDGLSMSGYKKGDIIERDPSARKDQNKFRKVNGEPVAGPYIAIEPALKDCDVMELNVKAPKVKVPKDVKDAVGFFFDRMTEGERCHMVNKLHKEGYMGTGPLASKGSSEELC